MTPRVRPARAGSEPARTYSFRPAAEGCSEHLVRVTEAGKTKSYWLLPFEADGGRGFRWSTFEGDGGNVYEVFVSADPAAEPHRCECLGHLRWGHRTVCRHLACTLKLLDRGKL